MSRGYLYVAATIITLAAVGISRGTASQICDLQFLHGPPSETELHVNHRYNFTCVFRSTCRPKMSFLYDITGRSDFINVNSKEIRIDQGRSYDFPLHPANGNIYTTEMIIDPVYHQYAGDYKCQISIPSDPDTHLSYSFKINTKRNDAISSGQCFVPHAENISAIKHDLPDGSLTVSLQWQLSKKEDTKLEYCQGSRSWKVRVLNYSTIAVAPGDYEVREEPSVSWIDISGQSTSYDFQEVLTPNMYYSFQVGHQEDKFSSLEIDNAGAVPQVFASSIYYFGSQKPAVINKSPSNIIKLRAGSSASVVCTASGFPPPSIDWVRTSGSPSYSRKNNSAILELNHVTKADAGSYICIAFNVIVNPPKGRRDQPDSWKITVEVEDYVSTNTGLTCNSMSLESSICKSYIYSGLKIFTDHTTNETSIARETRALDLATQVNYQVPLGKCRDLAHSALCHMVYPYCDMRPGKPTPRKLCKSVCEEFLTGSCKGLISQDSSIYSFLMEGCESSLNSREDDPECVPLSFQAYRNDQNEPIQDTGDCVRGDGRGYSGSIYRTKSGDICQMWSLQTPHPHPMLPEMYRSDLDHAGFSCRNPGGIRSKPWCYTNNPDVRWGYCDIPKCDSCQKYTGDTCKRIEGYSNTSVIVRRGKRVQSMEAIEDKISLFSKSILFMQPTEGCRDIVQVLLCHGAFPQCTGDDSKQLCADHCRLTRTLEDLCPEVYKEYSTFLSSNGDFMSEIKCDTEGDQCMTVPVAASGQGNWNSTQQETQQTESACYEGTGLNYNGTVSQTIGGLECQSWDVQQPHSHSTTPSMYPILQNSKNYCRNPGNLLDRPWCYTTSEKTVWDYCNIPICSVERTDQPVVDKSQTETLTETNESSSSLNPLIATMSVIFVIFAVLMVVAFSGCFVFMSRKNRRAKARNVRLSKITHEAFLGEKYVTNKDYTKVTHSKRSQSLVIPENFKLLDSKDIKYVSQLGQGNFGIVFKGKAFGIKEGEGGDEEGIDVAVKTLKEEASSEVKEDFIDEAKLMFTFDHPNILKIHGVCMSEMPYQLVFEYMDEGDLTKFLRARASSQQRRLINPFSYRSRTESSFSDDPPSLTKTQLLYICKQIAAGMKYLAEKKHVHRDLACRNCLIKSDLVVKIGDFGMSRNLYSKDYYRINGNAVLPVRWMSPESLIYGKFSVEGDVWSYGVVMWEVFSFALQPYYGISNEEVTEAIRRGKTLNRPDDCPIEVYRLMKECWTMDPADRIPFPELYDRLSALHQVSSLSGSLGEPFTDDEDDDAFSDSSEMPSDAFYSEEHLDDISNEVDVNL